MIEVELKARVADPEACEARLATFAHRSGSFDKADEYWVLGGADAPMAAEERGRAFRIRESGGRAVVTRKRKERSGGIETNVETEFEVSDAAAFRELALGLGARPALRKRKRGSAWEAEGALIELCEVAGLGHFLEIEILLREGAPEGEIAEARAKLLALLVKAGLTQGDIEPRYYADMLAGGA